MLMRRFTIVCLLLSIFGMLLAALIAQADRHRNWQTGMVVPCIFDDGIRCAPRVRR